MDLEEKSPTIVDKIRKLKSDDERSPRHTKSFGTDQHHFDLQTCDGHILKIRVHEDKELTTVFIDSETHLAKARHGFTLIRKEKII